MDGQSTTIKQDLIILLKTLIQGLTEGLSKQTFAFKLSVGVIILLVVYFKMERSEVNTDKSKSDTRISHLEKKVDQLQNNQTYLMTGALRSSNEVLANVNSHISENTRLMEKINDKLN